MQRAIVARGHEWLAVAQGGTAHYSTGPRITGALLPRVSGTPVFSWGWHIKCWDKETNKDQGVPRSGFLVVAVKQMSKMSSKPWLGLTAAMFVTPALAIDELPADMSFMEVDDGVMDIVSEALPERRNVSAEFLNSGYDPYLSLNKDANVSVSFLSEGAGFRNSLGYFTFNDSSFDGLSKADVDANNSGIVSLSELDAVDGVDWGWIFPNASAEGSGGLLSTGDTYQLNGEDPWAAGTNVAFFLGQNTWKKGDLVPGLEESNRQIMYGLDFLNPEAGSVSTMLSSEPASRHVGIMFADDTQTDVIMGFEDLNRVQLRWDGRQVSDEDFNDAVFMVTADPASAFGESNIVTAPAPLVGGRPLSMVLALLVLGWGLVSLGGTARAPGATAGALPA